MAANRINGKGFAAKAAPTAVAYFLAHGIVNACPAEANQMSQNSNVLMLFFEDKAQHESCVLAIVNLIRGDDAKSQVWQEQLGVDLTSHWHEDWFNHEFRAQPEFIRLAFDSSTTSSLPLELLLSLFEHGLQAAVIEVFHDQVGETERHHFLAGALVNPDDLYRHKTELRAIVEQEVGEVDEEGGCTEVRVRRPVPLRKLIAEARKNEAQAREAVEGIVGLAKAARESGTNPIQLMKGVMVLWAIGKGLLHAVIFTVVALVFFKGVWLWVGIGLLLAIVLPLIYAVRANAEFAGGHAE